MRLHQTLVIDRYENFEGVEVVLAARFAATITSLTAGRLADLAIASARLDRTGRDGITYLIDAKRDGIATPLSDAYEQEILRRTQARDLTELTCPCAWVVVAAEYCNPAPAPVAVAPPPPARAVRDEVADRMLALRQDCDEGDRRACVRLGILIGEHRERRAAWRREHPEVFFYER